MSSQAPVLVPVAHGSESLETITVVNLLRRADLAVTMASIEATTLIDGTRGIRFMADARLAELPPAPWSMLVLPGGAAAADALGRHPPLVAMLTARRNAGLPIAAICAAPARVLAANGLLEGRRATGFPSFRAELPIPVDAAVVRDGPFTTSQGPGTAIAFALDLIDQLCGHSRRDDVAAGLLVR
ncbi:MAG: DJ-1/PfpI family protein [Gammaproteobacteria bacterium]|nr:DJ-1/PfpI family protein [Gammaproteobacteria bacterium]